MRVKEILEEASSLIDERGADYGGVEENFNHIAGIANAILSRDLTAFEIAVVLASVKLARMRQSPYKLDNYLDGINYLSFAAMLRPGTEPVLSEQENQLLSEILNAPFQSRFRTAEDGTVSVEGR